MIIKFTSIFILFVFIASANSRKVDFSVIAFGTKVNVKIGETYYKLEKKISNEKNIPLYHKQINVDDSVVRYAYEVDGKIEPFIRTLTKGTTTTHNEFFGRELTIKELPQLSHPDSKKWNRTIGRSFLFDDSYIPTVHISGKAAEERFSQDGGKLKEVNLEGIDFILKDNTYSFKNVPCKPKNYKWNKMQFKVTLPGDGIDGRYVLKFRDNNEDPSFLRQDLYGDIMTAIGCPTIQSIKTRVYINGKAVGYYILQEEAASESFIRATFHGKSNGSFSIKNIKDLGHPLDCSTGADFYYEGNDFGSFQPYNSKRYDNSRVRELTKAFEKLDVNNPDEVKAFDKNWFDIDTFFKAIAMQYLTGHWDSYWFFSSNFAVYDDPTESTSNTFKFYFICQDWDGTFGVNLGMPYTVYDDEWTTHSYKDFLNLKWPTDNYGSPKRYAIDKLLSSKTLQTRFEKILTDIVKYVLNPNSIFPRIDALVQRHREEIEWGYNVTPLRRGNAEQNNWTVEDFDTAIEIRGRKGSLYGLKEYIHRRAKYINEEFNLGIDIPKGGYEEYSNDRCGDGIGKCFSMCCSQFGYCGTSDDHCGTGCQLEFGKKCNNVSSVVTKTVSKITTTTKSTSTSTSTSPTSSTLPISIDGICGSESGTRCPENKCCSQYGYCGTSVDYCGTNCQPNYGICGSVSVTPTTTTTTSTKTVTTDDADRCGSEFNKKCPGTECCSKYGYCGSTSEYCGIGCQASFGICN